MSDESTDPEIEVRAEPIKLEETPDEIKKTAKGISNDEIDSAYKLSEEEVERLKGSIPNNLQEPIVDSKIETGMAPQWWLVGLNNAAFALVAFVPGLNVMYAAVLYANLKILPMFPKKKLKNEIIDNIRGFKSEPPKKQPDKKDEDKKQSFGTEGENDTKQSFGTKEDDTTRSFFGTKSNNTNQTFGIKKTSSLPNISFGTKAGTTGQGFGTGGGTSAKQSFGTASPIEALRGVKTSHSTVPRKTSFGTYKDIKQNREKQRKSSFGLRPMG